MKFIQNISTDRRNELWVFLEEDGVLLSVDHTTGEIEPVGSEVIKLDKYQVQELINILAEWVKNADSK
jgi:hypothetical protein